MCSPVKNIFLCILVAALLPGCVNQRQIDARNELRNSQIPFSEKAFLKAVGDGDARTVSLFLEGGINPNEGSNIKNALILAVDKGNLEIARMLLDHGARVDAAGSFGTPLCVAATKGDVEAIELLLSRGARINYVERDNNPLLLASRAGHEDAVRLLLEKKAWRNMQGENNLFSALIVATLNGHEKVVGALLAADVDPNLRDHLDKTALDYAVIRNNHAIAELLLNSGKIKDDVLRSALVSAISLDNAELCRRIIAAGADVNFKYGSLPLLSWAISLKHSSSAEVLISSGANPDIPDSSGMKPIDYALEADLKNIAALLSAQRQ